MKVLLSMLLPVIAWAAPRIPEPVSYDAVVQFLQGHPEIRTVEALLAELPPTFRRGFTLMYKTGSLQGADPAHPRVIFYGRDGSFVLAAGGPGLKRWNTLEAIQFRPPTASFEFHEITFSTDGKSAADPSPANPALCLTCHGKDPRPNWERYPHWPGAYGENHDRVDPDFMPPDRAKQFRDFLAGAATDPRYQYLEGLVDAEGGYAPVLRNEEMTMRTAMENMQRVSRLLLASPGYSQYKFALAMIAQCRSEQVLSAIPQNLRAKFAELPKWDDELRAQMGEDDYDPIDKLFPFLAALDVKTPLWSMDYLSQQPGFSTPSAPNQEFQGWWVTADKALQPFFELSQTSYLGVGMPHASPKEPRGCEELVGASQRAWR